MESYYDLGKGYPIVMLHSFNHSKLMWEYSLPWFLEHGYRVIAPDLRGHGENELNGREMSIDKFSDDVIELLDKLGIKKAAFLGSSAGGYTTLDIWKKRPDLISAMVLAGSKAQRDSEEIISRRKEQIKTLKDSGLKGHLDNVHKRLAKNTVTNKPWVLDLVRSMSANMSQDAIIGALEALISKPDHTDILSSINVPTLIICGKEDIFTPCEYSKYLNEHIANSELLLLKDAAHINPLDQPEIFNSSVLEFLKKNRIG